jgi:hypothetical protein
MSEMNDREFLGYMDIHCRTERKLFGKGQWERLCTLAKSPVLDLYSPNAEWASIDESIIDPLVTEARKFLCPSMSSERDGSLECELQKGHSCFHKAGGITWEDDIYDAVIAYRETQDGLSTPEPTPIPNNKPIIQDLVIADLEKRKQVGLERYGTYLQPGNGRDALVDLYQELIDATQYIRQEIEERRALWKVIAERISDAGFAMPERNYTEEAVFLRDFVRAMVDVKEISSRYETLYRERKGEVWFWSTGNPEDGDNASTITCPILIQPEDLRKILAHSSAGWQTAEQISNARDELVGSSFQQPICMVLYCPRCGAQHIDKEETENEYLFRIQRPSVIPGDNAPPRWTNPPHKSHLCQICKAIWRPAEVYTTGVQSIKAGKNDTWLP